jgi:hypothetical protein
MTQLQQALATVTPSARRVDDGWECPRGEQRLYMSLLGHVRRADKRCTTGRAAFARMPLAQQRAVRRYFGVSK